MMLAKVKEQDGLMLKSQVSLHQGFESKRRTQSDEIIDRFKLKLEVAVFWRTQSDKVIDSCKVFGGCSPIK